MTSTFPNSFSMDDLNALMKTAKPEEENTATCPHFLSEIEDPEEYINAVQELTIKWLNEMSEPIDSEDCMIVHKAILTCLIDKFIGFHSKGGIELHKEGSHLPGMCWERDAGKFQAMALILSSISLGEKDFMVDPE